MRLSRYSKGRPSNDGFSYVELLIAMVIVSVGVCSGLAGVRMGLETSHRASALELSRHFADAIRQISLTLAFRDPEVSVSFGPEEGAIDQYDDVDDLHNLDKCPPIQGDGTVATEFENWRQLVTITPLDPTTLTVTFNDQELYFLYQIVVTIKRGDEVIGEYRWLTADK